MTGISLKAAAVVGCMALTACVTTTVDKSYEEAEIYGPERYDGVVLHLHGCAGLLLFGHNWDFAQFMIDRGFLFVAPDSFADPRPPSGCPKVVKGGTSGTISRATWDHIARIRLEQAKHAIASIRADYPGQKIVVWGHSEGGNTAHQLEAHVDGVITTGQSCGFRNYGWTRVPENVPLLAIMGDSDPYLAWHGHLESMCKRLFKSPKWKFMIVEGAGHKPWIRRKAVWKAVDEFLTAVRARP